jgi:hypothetical protein
MTVHLPVREERGRAMTIARRRCGSAPSSRSQMGLVYVQRRDGTVLLCHRGDEPPQQDDFSEGVTWRLRSLALSCPAEHMWSLLQGHERSPRHGNPRIADTSQSVAKRRSPTSRKTRVRERADRTAGSRAASSGLRLFARSEESRWPRQPGRMSAPVDIPTNLLGTLGQHLVDESATDRECLISVL